jgi:hypothetical protein
MLWFLQASLSLNTRDVCSHIVFTILHRSSPVVSLVIFEDAISSLTLLLGLPMISGRRRRNENEKTRIVMWNLVCVFRIWLADGVKSTMQNLSDPEKQHRHQYTYPLKNRRKLLLPKHTPK